MQNEEKRLETVLKDYGGHIAAQIKRGFNKGLVFGYFVWENTQDGVEIQFIN